MKLVVTADLHYNIARSKRSAIEVAEEICGLRADALLLLGDIGGRDLAIVSDCLHIFDRFDGLKLFVAGNHDIWTHPGEDSLEKFEQKLPEVCRKAGFHPLDVEPATLGQVGFVGSMGWYDLSFRPEHLRIPLRFFEQKIAPGAAARTGGYEHLLADQSDVPESAMWIGTRWMDGKHARLPMSDVEFCQLLCERFDRHLEQVSASCDTIVAGLHHVPFRELVPHHDNPSWAFAGAYLGSEQFGEVMVKHPKLRYAFCGHTHAAGRVNREHIECINVGCTYVRKRYEILEI